MIRRLTVSNFRSLGEDVAIDLDRLTVLVGPNASGKSSVLDALQFLGDAVTTGLAAAMSERGGFNAFARGEPGRPGRPRDVAIRVDLELEHGAAHFALRLGDREGPVVLHESASVRTATHTKSFEFDDGVFRRLPRGVRPAPPTTQLTLSILGDDPAFRPLRDALAGIATCSPVAASVAEVRRREHRPRMTAAGSGWAEALESVLPGWKGDLVAALARLTGDVTDVQVRAAGDHPIVVFTHATGPGAASELYAAQESDGTLRVAAILTALFQPHSLLCVEEPEQTVHPGALAVLWDFLAECAQCRNQVIVTTHSPDFLDLVPPQSVRIVSRDGGVSGVRPMSPNETGMVRDRLVSVGGFVRMGGLGGGWADQVAEEPPPPPSRPRRTGRRGRGR